MEARPQTPATVAELGGLVELVIDAETAKRRTLRVLGLNLKTNDDGNLVWKFNPAKVKLAAGGDCELHIVGFYRARPADLQRGVSHKIGAVAAVTYRADKPHIQEGVKDYAHPFAEGGGEFPRLFFKDGYIFFRGGTYTLSEDGIDDGGRHHHPAVKRNAFFGLFGRGKNSYSAVAVNKYDTDDDIHPAKSFRANNATEARKQVAAWLSERGDHPRHFRIQVKKE
jgi:hypothetical protein